MARAKKLKKKLDWGRSGGFLRSRPSRLDIAEKNIDYPKFTIDGRHFVDTFLLAQFTMSGCVPSPASNASMSRGTLAFATVNNFPGCPVKNCSAPTGRTENVLAARALCRARDPRAFRFTEPELLHPGANFPLQLSGRDVRGNATGSTPFSCANISGSAIPFLNCRCRALSKAVTPISFSPAWRGTSGIATWRRFIRRSCCSSTAFPATKTPNLPPFVHRSPCLPA